MISLCPGVVECAAIGVADEKQGEAIKVFVVKSDPTLTEEDVIELLPAEPHRLQVPKTSNSATTCPRPTSARSCGGSCAHRR